MSDEMTVDSTELVCIYENPKLVKYNLDGYKKAVATLLEPYKDIEASYANLDKIKEAKKKLTGMKNYVKTVFAGSKAPFKAITDSLTTDEKDLISFIEEYSRQADEFISKMEEERKAERREAFESHLVSIRDKFSMSDEFYARVDLSVSRLYNKTMDEAEALGIIENNLKELEEEWVARQDAIELIKAELPGPEADPYIELLSHRSAPSILRDIKEMKERKEEAAREAIAEDTYVAPPAEVKVEPVKTEVKPVQQVKRKRIVVKLEYAEHQAASLSEFYEGNNIKVSIVEKATYID